MSEPTRSDVVAQAYARLEERTGAWATLEDDVRAAIVLGSRARDDHLADEFADLDIVVVTTDDSRPWDERSWLEAIGEPWISFLERTADSDGPELRVLFAGGFDVDFAFMTATHIGRLVENDPGTAAVAFSRGYRVLVDKDGLAARMIEAASRTAQASAIAPDAMTFSETCSNFWYHSVWTAKHLCRGELDWAKRCCDGLLKDLMRRVLEWEAATEGRDPWLRGRFLEEWADPDTIAGLRRAYAHYDEEEVWSALGSTMDLFADVARRTADRLDLAYDEAVEAHARELVARMRDTGSFVAG